MASYAKVEFTPSTLFIDGYFATHMKTLDVTNVLEYVNVFIESGQQLWILF